MSTQTTNLKLYKPDIGDTPGVTIPQLAQNFDMIDSAFTNEQKEAPVTDLKICFHFNYNTDESKMEDVRNLGFNTVWVYKQASFTQDSTDTLAFLDLLKKHGLKAIMQVNTTVITSSTPTSEQNWISAIEGHEALLGFTHFDEPCGQAISASNQNTAYNNIKAVTHKNVFLVEADSSPTSLYNYYTPNAYDVYLFDLYLDNGSYTTEQAFKTEAVRRILNLRNYTQNMPPKQIIPVFPLFSNPPSYNEPTEQTLKWIMDAWRPFIDGRNYAVFCYDVNGATGYTTLESSTNLQKLATLIPAYLISAPRTHMRLLPTGYTLSSSFVSATNAKYDNNNFPKIGSATSTAPVPNTVVITRLDISQGSKWAVLYAAIRQIQDGNNRQVSFDISYDNTNWTNLATDTFGGINTGNGYAHAIAITQDVSAIYCRFTLIPTSGTEYSQYWGFTGLGAVSI